MSAPKITIEIEVSEGFDRLSILGIKLKQFYNYSSEKTEENFDKINKLSLQIRILKNRIENSITQKLTQQIIFSNEYKNLYDINQKLFNLFDEIKKNNINALVPDQLNYQRFLAKNELQNKFFNVKSEEIKIGY